MKYRLIKGALSKIDIYSFNRGAVRGAKVLHIN